MPRINIFSLILHANIIISLTMKKLLFLLISIMLLTMTACNNDNTDYSNLIIGKWLCEHIDGEEVVTNDMFFAELTDKNVQVYGDIFTIENNHSEWMESANYTYSVANNVVTVIGTNPLGLSTTLVFEIQSIDDENMTYTVNTLNIDNPAIEDNHIYTCTKINADYSSNIAGIWSGYTYQEKHYWQYYEDGTYDFYYYDSIAEEYIPKENNNGRYFLHGDFIATIYTNDYNSGNEGTFCECWNLTFSDDFNSLQYEAKRTTESELTNLSLTRVANVGD
jgi:hypothetical protein